MGAAPGRLMGRPMVPARAIDVPAVLNSLAARLRVLEGKVATVAAKIEQQNQMLKGLEVRASEGGGPSGVATVLVDMCVGTDMPESELVGIASEVGSVYEALAASLWSRLHRLHGALWNRRPRL